ncbi:hypothetical protein KAFR_0J01350 [Kazachstania africana CBS 2517]|uniref:37S ribosomal protein S25, mitochondrial n=1 Tax=Kazachstania africana (strain ATCC 22294 / BCRC 22015 / CBS 2517 / CECT 1963 / NBRC 1671 / NRRL Y-8276) TaxID=1071382 RepID=H2B0Q2_KAZAF|nr:hypothetical protein KAFR_0J01350 [Kazachstania africana CBS 2517]CCF60202.1 hypothetical protein KAFR_0J01350 [Kazachstania africana CBS 2517]
MKIQTNATNILERTSAYLQAGLLRNAPAFYDVIAQVPPSTKFTREPKLVNPSTGQDRTRFRELTDKVNWRGLYKTRYAASDRHASVSRLYKASRLKYLEDDLRQLFYDQHPWELSRPKIVIENNIDNSSLDWSNIQQLGKPVDGESVVQRTLFLMKNKKHDNLADCYDQARFEFYQVRMQRDSEEQIATEEAAMFGSIFGPTALEYGIQREQDVIAKWKQRAIRETELLDAKRANPSDSWAQEESSDKDLDQQEEDEEIEELQL